MAYAFEQVTSPSGEVSFVSAVEPAECAVMIHAFDELIEMLTPSAEVEGQVDPLFDQLGLGDLFDRAGGGEVVEPQEPVSARLFPPGYIGDSGAARDFRRFTEPELRQEKIDNAMLISQTLATAAAADPPQVILRADDVTPWLLSLNDLRLTFAVQVGIGEPDEVQRLANPAIRTVRELYDFLTWWQGSLLEVMS